MKDCHISILIPAFNEAGSITRTIEQVRHVMNENSITHEIIVVDDGSLDDTPRLAEAAGARVIRHPTNRGYGRALKTGMHNAVYDWCAIVDADGSYPVDRFPDLLSCIPQFDMVVGSRTGRNYWGSFGKRVSRLFLLSLVSYVVGVHIPDVNSGMRVFRKDIALAHVKRISSGFSFTTTLTLAMFLEEHFVNYVPIQYHPRVGKSKVKLGIDSLRMLQILIQAILYYNPLKLFLSVCLASVAIGLIALLSSVLAGATSAGLFFLGNSVLVAILVGAIGLLAELVRATRLMKI
jgi:glycosyltransferase involved in cell wall biosynthesis